MDSYQLATGNLLFTRYFPGSFHITTRKLGMDCYPQNPNILVVSPLISVIEDQLKSLSKRNVSALALPVGFEISVFKLNA